MLTISCADLEGGSGGSGPPPPLEFSKLNIVDVPGNEKISYFSYLCTSTVIRQTESILLKVGPPPGKNFWIRACYRPFFNYENWKENNDYDTNKTAASRWGLTRTLNLDSPPACLLVGGCLLYTSPSPRDLSTSRMPSSA